MLPSILSDHAVLQRETDIHLWGYEEPDTVVTIEFRGQSGRAVAGSDGRWEVKMPSGSAGGPFEMRITSPAGKRVLEDLLVGEVLIGGGQSNLWWPVRRCFEFEKVQAASEDDQLRLFDTNTHPRSSGWRMAAPQRTIDTRWQSAHPDHIGDWPSTAYFCAVKLRQALGVPVGILHFAVPGSAIQPHIDAALAECRFPEMMADLEREAATYPERLRAYENGPLAEWNELIEAHDGEPPPGRKPPKAPRNPESLRFGGFFNAMIAPCLPWNARAVLWWQGEGNQYDPAGYRTLFPTLIENWRTAWRDPAMPFLFVELANIGPHQTTPVEEESFPAIRDAQKQGLNLPGVHMVTATDVKRESEPVWEIHPADKQRVGERLADALLAEVYETRPGPAVAPVLHAADFEGKTVRLTFDHAEGLSTSDGEKPRGFAIAGADRVWHWAEAVLEGESVVVTAPAEVEEPVAVRYGWANNPIGNLTNASRQPCAAFRTDDWPLKNS